MIDLSHVGRVFDTSLDKDGVVTVLYFGKPIGWMNKVSYENSNDYSWRAVTIRGVTQHHHSYESALDAIKTAAF